MKSTALGTSSAAMRPRMLHVRKAAYVKRVSTSPHLSPTKEPSGCWRPATSGARARRGGHGGGQQARGDVTGGQSLTAGAQAARNGRPHRHAVPLCPHAPPPHRRPPGPACQAEPGSRGVCKGGSAPGEEVQKGGNRPPQHLSGGGDSPALMLPPAQLPLSAAPSRPENRHQRARATPGRRRTCTALSV
jgi:hypothetical protein